MRTAHVLSSCLLAALVGCGASTATTDRTETANRIDTNRPSGEKPDKGDKGQPKPPGNTKGLVPGTTGSGQQDRNRRLQTAREHLHALALVLGEHMLAQGTSRFPASFAEVKTARTLDPELGKLVAAGEIVVPWGESANQLVWAWWKDTPETGGPYIRYDLKRFDNAKPDEFAKQKGVKLTVKTIPPEYTNSGPWEKPEKAFFVMNTFAEPLRAWVKNPALPGPKSLSEYPVFATRNEESLAVLRLIESGQLVVRWDRHPARGLYAYYPKNFPLDGGWAVVDGVPKDYTSLEARKLIADDK